MKDVVIVIVIAIYCSIKTSLIKYLLVIVYETGLQGVEVDQYRQYSRYQYHGSLRYQLLQHSEGLGQMSRAVHSIRRTGLFCGVGGGVRVGVLAWGGVRFVVGAYGDVGFSVVGWGGFMFSVGAVGN